MENQPSTLPSTPATQTTSAAPAATDDTHKGRRILYLVFTVIIGGTLKDLYDTTFGLLWKYVKHLWLCLYYFWSPDIDRPPFDTFDFKEFCKHSFQGVILTLLISVFMVKMNWLASTNDRMKEELGNDLFQMQYQAALFLAFSLTYFILVVLSIVTGRIIRRLLTPEVSHKESDILMITFFNSFFSLTALTALIIRFVVRFGDNELSSILGGVAVILALTCLLLTLVWAFRFVYLNQVHGWKAIVFFLLSVLVYPIMFTAGGIITTLLLYIV